MVAELFGHKAQTLTPTSRIRCASAKMFICTRIPRAAAELTTASAASAHPASNGVNRDTGPKPPLTGSSMAKMRAALRPARAALSNCRPASAPRPCIAWPMSVNKDIAW
jgi:hypothetical protein